MEKHDSWALQVLGNKKFFLKLAHEVNMKLGFMDWFFYNLIALIKQCKILLKKFRQSSVVFKKSGILSEKLKALMSSYYYRLE